MVERKVKSSKSHKQIYVIAGKDESLVNVECEKLLSELLEPHQRVTGLFNAEPSKVLAADILDELRTAPFLSKKRVVLVKGADNFISRSRQLLEKYFDNPCDTGVLVLTVNSWPSNTKLAKKLSRIGKLISVTEPKRWQLPQRLIKYASDAHDKNLSRSTAEILIELAGDSLTQLYSEIDKLSLFADAEKTITASHIEALIGHNRLFNAFAVIDAISLGKVAQAIDRLRNMFAADKTAEFTVVGAFAFHFRRMFGAKVLLEKGLGSAETAKRLRIWGNKEAFFSQLKNMTLQELGDNLRQLAATDYAIKTGRTKPQVAVEQLVLRLAGR